MVFSETNRQFVQYLFGWHELRLNIFRNLRRSKYTTMWQRVRTELPGRRVQGGWLEAWYLPQNEDLPQWQMENLILQAWIG